MSVRLVYELLILQIKNIIIKHQSNVIAVK